jgi:hypothetical protein
VPQSQFDSRLRPCRNAEHDRVGRPQDAACASACAAGRDDAKAVADKLTCIGEALIEAAASPMD